MLNQLEHIRAELLRDNLDKLCHVHAKVHLLRASKTRQEERGQYKAFHPKAFASGTPGMYFYMGYNNIKKGFLFT